jgi:hypothetical protein
VPGLEPPRETGNATHCVVTEMRRNVLAALAVGLLIAGVALKVIDSASDAATGIAASLLRVATILGVLWLAWPNLAQFRSRPRGWLWLLGPLVVCVLRPQWIVWVAIATTVFLVLRSRWRIS